ncbi:GatB/YqeY domain-containing protein [Clostridium baratii]|uniref:GatB/Yqey domain-containing protein n=1 Tax=Clostridium baratii TaxID=1561 RepID=A0A174PRS2_9CLOT|nr:GatB/YqeY domain-containing protein [Clostridium baratii]CUP61025.1 GatB/Yqey domain-containing protein [Clostridium baratii]
MPTIKERLQEDWKTALKAKDKFKANVLSTAKSSILLCEKNGENVDDERVIEILAKEVKQRREAVLEFEKGNRQDLVDEANAEIAILLDYLPQQLSEEEILEIVKESAITVGASSIKDMGKVMALVRPKTVGKADGKLVSQLVKNYLNNN